MPKRVKESWEYRQVQVNHPRVIGIQNQNVVAVVRAISRVVEALLEVATVTPMKSVEILAPVDITSVLVVE